MEETKFCINKVCDNLEISPKTIKHEKDYDDLNIESCNVVNLNIKPEPEKNVKVLNEEITLKAEIIEDYRELEDDIDSDGEYLNMEDKILQDSIKLHCLPYINYSKFYEIERTKRMENNMAMSNKRKRGTKTKCRKKKEIRSTRKDSVDKKEISLNFKTFICDICSKIYRSKGSLLLHIQVHNGKRHKCEICWSTFSQKAHLTRHLKIHNGDKNFVCDICKKKFCVRGSLMLHKRTHTKEKPHKCDCGKSFSQLCNLKRHMLIHSGEKPFYCEICDQRFRQKGDLDQHFRLHTGEKPYTCLYCPKTFRTSSMCVAHVKRHHKK